MTNGATYLKGYELVGSIIEMLGGYSKTALTKDAALQAISLLAALKNYIPEDSGISFYLDCIIPACQSVQEFDQAVLEDSTKEALVNAFFQLKEGLATFLMRYFNEQEKVDVTPKNVPLLRSIVALALLGEEID
jgi:hypothetical protein